MAQTQDAFMQDILDRVDDLYDQTAKGLDETLAGTPMDAARPTDEQFAAFVELRVNGNPLTGQPPDPDFLLALVMPNVAGGRDWLTRYEQARGLR